MIAKRLGRPDYFILFCVGLLVVFGLVMLASASSHLGETKFGNSYFYLKHQILYGLSLGILGFLAAYAIPYSFYRKIALPLIIVSALTLFLVFTPLGFRAGGAERWVSLGPITFQPAEFLKLAFIIYLAAWLSGDKERVESFSRGYLPFLLVAGAISILLIKQPSTSVVAILMASALIVYFVSGAKLKYIFGTIVLGVAALAVLIYVTPYRFQRVVNFLHPQADQLGAGYHLNQALIAIGSGGLTGVGYGQSTTKINFLPEPIGDSIFAVIAEETGFIGASVLILLFMALVIRTFMLARKTTDKFGKLLLVGFGSLIALQAAMNIGAISGLLPLTGTPLPFISYGGTALAVFMTMGGIIVNISRYS